MSDYFNNYNRKCKDTQGGIKKVYLLPYVEYNEIQVQSDGMSLTVFPESTVYEFEVNGNYTQNSSFEKGNTPFAHVVNVEFPKVYTTFDINAFVRNDFRVIVLTENDHLIMFGTNNGLTATINNASGTSKGEFNGFSVSFNGQEEKTGLLIDSLDDFFNVSIDITDINYGALYNWYAVDDSRNLAPDGWRVPTFDEFTDLRLYLDPTGTTIDNIAGTKLKEIGTFRWDVGNTGDNSTGFTAVGNGIRDVTGVFSNIKATSLIYTSTQVDSTSAYLVIMYNNTESLKGNGAGLKETGCAVRLISDATGLADGVTTTMIGNDGKAYLAVVINGLYWITSNYAETKYRNGDWIAGYDGGTYTPISNVDWGALTTGAMCAYKDDESNILA